MELLNGKEEHDESHKWVGEVKSVEIENTFSIPSSKCSSATVIPTFAPGSTYTEIFDIILSLNKTKPIP